jgi:hypothetical protein
MVKKAHADPLFNAVLDLTPWGSDLDSVDYACTTGIPDHKLRGQDDALRRHCSVFENVNEHLNGQYARSSDGLPNGG